MPNNEIIIKIHKDDPEAFYAKIPYDLLPKIHRVGGKWMQSGKEWRFPLDENIWEKFQQEFKEEFNNNLVKKDLSFILAFDKRKKDLNKFMEAKKVAVKDEPTDFGVEGISLNGKNCLFNYQRWGVKCGLSVGDGFLIGDVPGLGKALAIDTQVFTTFGKKKIGDINMNDKVIGSDGKSYNITGIYPQGIRPVYKITFNDGYEIECDEEHLWTVYDRHKQCAVTLTVKELLNKDLIKTHIGNGHNASKEYKYKTYYKEKDNCNHWQIPVVKPIQFENNNELLIDPYLFGLMLGDGHFNSNKVQIRLEKNDFDEIFQKYLDNNYLNARINENFKHETCKEIVFDCKDILDKLNFKNKRSWDKYIPDVYKYASIEDRIALLQGLMDTDGYCMKASKNRNNQNIFSATEYSSVSEQLVDDVAELVQGLGGICRKHSKKSSYIKNGIRHECRTSYRLNIKMSELFIPFRLKRKADLYHIPQKYAVARFIKNIDYIGEKECICIAVDSPDHLYVVEHAIVTHNTIQGLGIAVERKNRGEVKNCLIVCPASLKYNWKSEIEKFTKEKAIVIGHKCKNKEEREKHWIADGYFFKITNYEMVARDLYAEPKKTDNRIASYKAVLSSFDMVIFDECHMLKHHSSQRTQACRLINAKYRIGLSGTPIDGRLEEIHSIFQILKPGLFISKQKFMERYAEFDYFGAVKGYHHVKEVSDKIAPYYLRRLKEEVAKDMPPKIYKDMRVELSDKNMKAYKDIIKKKGEITENASALELIIRARQFLDFPEILGLHNTSDKFNMFKDLLDELIKENNQKVVVFSQYTNTIHWLVKNLEDEYPGIKVIDGSVSSEERLNICNEFNNDPDFHLLICSDAANFGLNMGKADAVIHYTLSFQPSIQLQRDDRAHRISNEKGHNVTIYRFICNNTVEEHVMDILAKKQIVNNALLNEDNDSFSVGDMSAMEILSCL